MVNSPPDRASAQAGANLMVAVDIVAGIVRFDPEYLVVPHVQT